jgi:hypothetical protein
MNDYLNEVLVWDATVFFVAEVIFESNLVSLHARAYFGKKPAAGFF